jgi:hypothetical protein
MYDFLLGGESETRIRSEALEYLGQYSDYLVTLLQLEPKGSVDSGRLVKILRDRDLAAYSYLVYVLPKRTPVHPIDLEIDNFKDYLSRLPKPELEALDRYVRRTPVLASRREGQERASVGDEWVRL